jgi:hypothetical protein
VTPPALSNISGKINTFLFVNISEPAIVVGPLAASANILQLILSALYLLTALSSAAGIKISHYL